MLAYPNTITTDKVGAKETDNGKYSVVSTSDTQCQDIVLSSVIPPEESIGSDEATFSINVASRPGKTLGNGKLLLQLDSDVSGNSSFLGIVYYKDDTTFELQPSLADLPYVAGSRADGLYTLDSVSNITGNGVALRFIVLPDGDSKADVIKFIKGITVKYAWVAETA